MRSPGGAVTADLRDPAAGAKPGSTARAGISWLGLIGGLLGSLPLGALGIEVLLNPPEAGRGPAAMLLALAALYLLAIWVSLRPTPRRRAVQRAVVAGSIVVVLVSLPFFGAAFAVVLLPATALLAIASGLVFGR